MTATESGFQTTRTIIACRIVEVLQKDETLIHIMKAETTSTILFCQVHIVSLNQLIPGQV